MDANSHKLSHYYNTTKCFNDNISKAFGNILQHK